MNTLFPISVALYFAATLICFAGASFRKARLTQIARLTLVLSIAAHLA